MLSHLIYVSNRKPECTDQEIQSILASCQKNNKDIDITGVLLYSPTQFVQYIEGPYKVLTSLYDKIKLDSRHRSVVMISSAPIATRSFASWQMGSRNFSSSKIDFNTSITDSEKRMFEEILAGKSQDGNKAIALIQKFFR